MPYSMPMQAILEPLCECAFIAHGSRIDRAQGNGPSCPRPVQQDHELQPKEPKMAQQRQICLIVSATIHFSTTQSTFFSRGLLCSESLPE